MPADAALVAPDHTAGLDPTLRPEALAAWIRTLPPEAAGSAAQSVLDRFEEVKAQRLRTGLKQETLEHFFSAFEALLPLIRQRFQAVALPLDAQDRALVQLGDELIAALLRSYRSLLDDACRRLFGLASNGRALLPLVRTMRLLCERIALHQRIHASPPKGTWSALHDAYRLAAPRGLAHKALPTEPASPLLLYKRALLAAFANPLHFQPGDLGMVEALIDAYGHLAELGVSVGQSARDGMFIIRPDRDLPGHALFAPQPAGTRPDQLVLDTGPVAAALTDLAQAPSSTLLDHALPGLASPPGMDPLRKRVLLARLMSLWGAATGRRAKRLQTDARVEVQVGIEAIWSTLATTQAPDADSADWVITNESPGGFALKKLGGPIPPVQVGAVVGLRSLAQKACHICVVRWVLSDHPEHLELGLEELSPSARPVHLRPTDNPQALAHRALLLPQGQGGTDEGSLLTPVTALPGSFELSVGELQSKIRIRATALVEQTTSIQRMQFATLD